MRIRECDPLEIFVSNEGEIIFKKYSPISELSSIAAQYCLEDQIENRRSFSAGDGQPLQPIEGVAYYALVQSPIISSGDVRQRDVPAKQGKRLPQGRRAKAHSGGGELSREADGAVMVTGAPSGQ